MFFFTFLFSILPLSCAQPQTRSSTPTPASTPTPSHTPGPPPLCPATVCTQYTFLPDLVNPQYWDVPSGQEYIWVNMWGSGGYDYTVNTFSGYGAFVSGALSVTSGEQLRVIVGSRAETDKELELGGCPSLYYGGGRSAIQRLNASGVFVDVVAAGGGGGGGLGLCRGGDAGSGSAGNASFCNPDISGGENDSSGGCLFGNRSCGEDVGTDGFGGGGWCGGLVGTINDGGGGGSSYSSPLQCSILADHIKGNFFETPIQAPSGAGQPGLSGAVIIAALPSGWQPCSAITTSSPTPSVTATSSITPSQTPSQTPTPSESSTITTTPSETSSSSLTPSITSSHTPTSSNTPSISPTPSITPSVTPSITDTPSITSSFSSTASITSSFPGTPSNTPSITSSTSPSSTQLPLSPPSSSSSSSVITSPIFSIAGWSIASLLLLGIAAWMFRHCCITGSNSTPANFQPQFSAPTDQYEALN